EMTRKIREVIADELGAADAATRAHWARVRRDLLGAQISTIHAFAARVLRENPLEAGVDPRAVVLDEHESRTYVESTVEAALLAHLRAGDAAARDLVLRAGLAGGPSGGAVGLVADFLARLGRTGRDGAWLVAATARQAARAPEASEAPRAAGARPVATSDALRARKREDAVLTFDDLIGETRAVLAGYPAVRERYARRFRAILVDEFQDTDRVQAEIVRLLAAGAPAPLVFVVGDEKQSIYRFRGADVSVFQDMRAELGCELPLGTNFRSVPAVLDFVNALAAAILRVPPGGSPSHWTRFDPGQRLLPHRGAAGAARHLRRRARPARAAGGRGARAGGARAGGRGRAPARRGRRPLRRHRRPPARLHRGEDVRERAPPARAAVLRRQGARLLPVPGGERRREPARRRPRSRGWRGARRRAPLAALRARRRHALAARLAAGRGPSLAAPPLPRRGGHRRPAGAGGGAGRRPRPPARAACARRPRHGRRADRGGVRGDGLRGGLPDPVPGHAQGGQRAQADRAGARLGAQALLHPARLRAHRPPHGRDGAARAGGGAGGRAGRRGAPDDHPPGEGARVPRRGRSRPGPRSEARQPHARARRRARRRGRSDRRERARGDR